MKYLIAIICFITLVSFSPNCKESYGIKKAWLFSKQRFAGTIARDENGKQITKGHWHTHFLYLEVDKENIATWDSLRYNNQVYTILTTPIKQEKIEVGKALQEEIPIIIKPKNNNTLLVLDIQDMDIPFENKEYKLVLLGTINNKKIAYEILRKNINLAFDLTP